jgi:group I intron endonuclease
LSKNKGSSNICKAILKYGIENFALVILEQYPVSLPVAEQYWIDLLKPEYNIETNVIGSTKRANNIKPNRSGPNNSFYGRKHTLETKALLSAAASTRLNQTKPGYQFLITDILTGITTTYSSIRLGVKAMKWDN